MVWGSKTQISSAVTVDSATLQDRSTALTLNPGETAHVQVECDFGTTPTGDMEVHVQTTLDDTTEKWDTVPFGAPFVIPNTTDPGVGSFLIVGGPSVYKFSLMYKNSTGTTSNSVSAWYRKDGVSL